MFTYFSEQWFEHLAPLPSTHEEEEFSQRIHPSRWCISYQQLLDVDRLARETFGNHDDYSRATMRDICNKIITPRCKASGKSYALILNPQGLAIDCFLTHSWDGQFQSFVQSIQQVFQTTVTKPNIWICAFAINQAATLEVESVVGSADDALETTPFVQALQQAKTFCVVRNSNTDLYSRIWCVCELMYAKQLRLFPNHTHVTGPDVFAKIKSSCLDADATKAEDKKRILQVLLDSHDREEIDSIVQIFRTHDTPTTFPELTRHSHLKTILHPLKDLDEDLMAEHLERFHAGTREWAIKGFDDWFAAGGNHRVFVLMAQAGTGKTGIVCKIIHDRRDQILAHHFCRHDDSRRRDPKQMLLSLAYQIACKIPEYCLQLEEVISSQDLSRADLLKEFNIIGLFDAFLAAPLARVSSSGDFQRRVIFIDALDECDEMGKNEMLLCIQRHFPKLPSWVSIYITTRPEIPILDKLKKFSPYFIEPDEEQNRSDLKIFFRSLVEEVGSKEIIHDKHTRELAVQSLLDKTGGLFIYATHLASMARSDYGSDVTLHDLESLPSGLEEFYEAQFERILTSPQVLSGKSSNILH